MWPLGGPPRVAAAASSSPGAPCLALRGQRAAHGRGGVPLARGQSEGAARRGGFLTKTWSWWCFGSWVWINSYFYSILNGSKFSWFSWMFNREVDDF